MSDEYGRDYNRGLSGQGGAGSTNFEAYQAGAAARQDLAAQQARIDGGGKSAAGWGPMPKVDVSPTGCAAVIVAPFLAVAYPLAGTVAVAAFAAGNALGELIFSANERGLRLLIGFLAMLPALPFGMMLEGIANRFLIYRLLRYPIRIGLLGGGLSVMILTNGEIATGMDLETAWYNATPRQAFYCIAVFPIVWLFTWFLDHFAFPSMGLSPKRAAAKAERAAQVARGERPAFKPVHVSLSTIAGLVVLTLILIGVTPLHPAEAPLVAVGVFVGVMLYRRRRAARRAG